MSSYSSCSSNMLAEAWYGSLYSGMLPEMVPEELVLAVPEFEAVVADDEVEEGVDWAAAFFSVLADRMKRIIM